MVWTETTTQNRRIGAQLSMQRQRREHAQISWKQQSLFLTIPVSGTDGNL